MERPVIRTITLGLGDPHPVAERRVEQAADLLGAARKAFAAAGYEVQTVRISMRPVLDDLGGPAAELTAYGRRLQAVLDAVGLDHCSLGTVDASRPDFAPDRLQVIEDLLPGLPALSCSVLLATAERDVRREAASTVARTMLRIAERTEGGAGNFRFAALACVEPGCPFFPAGYHRGPDTLGLGLQSASVVFDALDGMAGPDPAEVTRRTRAALTAAAAPVVELGQRLAAEAGVGFGGVDMSPAPSVHAGIARALERGIGGPFGGPGTLATVGAVTRAVRSTGLPTCGYNGLMLPVLEDPLLAALWEQGALTAHQLLAYSSVCGTGLDTVPLPAGTTVEQITGLLLDMATLAVKLTKPLSARLFPLPGVAPGERTSFGSPHLVDIRLPGGR